MSEDTTTYHITSQQTLILVVHALANEPLKSHAVASLAEQLDIGRDSVFRTLKNLEIAGWARQGETGGWSLGVSLCQISERLRQALNDIHKLYLDL